MSKNIKEFLEILNSRGFIHQTTDLKQLEKFVVNLFGLKFPLGKLITQFIKFCVFIIFIYLALTFFMNYTDLIKL